VNKKPGEQQPSSTDMPPGSNRSVTSALPARKVSAFTTSVHSRLACMASWCNRLHVLLLLSPCLPVATVFVYLFYSLGMLHASRECTCFNTPHVVLTYCINAAGAVFPEASVWVLDKKGLIDQASRWAHCYAKCSSSNCSSSSS
jgi:hypothetical protein